MERLSLIEQIFRILDRNKYQILNYNGEISISRIGVNRAGQKYVDQELEIVIIINGDKSTIGFRERGRMHDRIEAVTDSEILSSTIIMCSKHYEYGHFEPQFSQELDKLLKEDCIEKAIEMVCEKVPDNLFSIFTPKENAVCLLKHTNEFVIKYYSKSFQKQVNQFPIKLDEITRAYGVLFNYSYKLKLFNDIYNKMVELNFIENDCEETYNYYLNIYL